MDKDDLANNLLTIIESLSLNEENNKLEIQNPQKLLKINNNNLEKTKENKFVFLDKNNIDPFEKYFNENINEIDENSSNDDTNIKDQILLEVNNLIKNNNNYVNRSVGVGSGGGSVAKQFANGGTMNGNLTVNGNITANNFPSSNSGLSAIPDPLYLNSINSENLSSINLSATEITVDTLNVKTIKTNFYSITAITLQVFQISDISTRTYVLSANLNQFVTLPNTNISQNRIINLKKKGTGTLLVSGFNNSQLIDDQISQSFSSPSSLSIQCLGSEWLII